MGEEAADPADGLVAAGDPLARPTSEVAPEAVGEVQRRRACGSKGKRREWFLQGKGERRGELMRGKGKIAVATYNIRDGKNGGLLCERHILDKTYGIIFY